LKSLPIGVFPILDEECNFPKASDLTFCDKLSKNHEKNVHFKRPLTKKNVFVIFHYAGEVSYVVDGFLQKNRDTLTLDIMRLMLNSEDEFISKLFAIDKEQQKQLKTAFNKHLTLAGQFKEQLVTLMAILEKTEPHFIRAIKPNNVKIPNQFDAVNTMRQFKYSGLLETVKIRSKGYAHRPTFQHFYEEFKCIVLI